MPYIKRFIAFLAFVVITTGGLQGNSIGNSTSLREASKKSTSLKTLRSSPKLLETYYSQKLDELGLKLHPGTEHRTDSKPTIQSSQRCKSIVYRTLLQLPKSHSNQLTDLTLFYTKDGRRGYGGAGSIVLRCLNVADNELASVLIHEIGHLVDGDLLFGTDAKTPSGFYDFEVPVAIDDPSLDFYRISWTSEKTRTEGDTLLDFVSEYASTDPFEDFAETYTYYRLHGAEFRQLMEFNNALQQKYSFMKKYVFDGEEFNLGATKSKLDLWARNYDVTVLPFQL
ncbi:hypothetical protein HYW83_04185 [Candidatus Peregrinibacteria bacterium]|nr:hypothetical protein [Candidatus Peregrinibacteria bacterium]